MYTVAIDSRFRDRNAYSNPGEFQTNDASHVTGIGAVDPISDQSGHFFSSGSFSNAVSANTVAIASFNPVASQNNRLDLTAAAGTLRTEPNFYRGATLQAIFDGVTYLRNIVQYEYIDGIDTARVTLSENFPDNVLTGGAVITLSDRADPVTRGTVFVPQTDSCDSFVGWTVYNRTRDESRTITSYDSNTALATLSSVGATWMTTDHYTFSRRPVHHRGTIVSVSSTGTAVQLATSANATNGAYSGGFIRIVSDNAGALPTTPAAGVAPFNEARRIGRYIAGSSMFTAIGGNTFTIASSPKGAVNANDFIGAMITTPIATYQISSYTLSTTNHSASGTITGVFGAETIGDVVEFRTAFLTSAFSTNPTPAATLYDFEMYTRDNLSALDSSGKHVHHRQEEYQFAKLLTLTLPRRDTDSGLDPTAYPYLLVELRNTSRRGHAHDFSTNNLNGRATVFQARLDNSNTTGEFIHLSGNDAFNRFLYTPSNGLYIRVATPDGVTIGFEKWERYGPERPNDCVQINTVFSFREIPR